MAPACESGSPASQYRCTCSVLSVTHPCLTLAFREEPVARWQLPGSGGGFLARWLVPLLLLSLGPLSKSWIQTDSQTEVNPMLNHLVSACKTHVHPSSQNTTSISRISNQLHRFC